MTQYWPYEQSEELNNEVAFLFASTKKKLYHNLSNITSKYLYIDILDNKNKYIFCLTTLEEIEKLLLEVIDCNLTTKDLTKINYQLLCNVMQKATKKIFYRFNNKNKAAINKINYHNKSILQFDHQLLLGNLLIYLLFGSQNINSDLFEFNNKYTPKAHVSILLENCIIQISNLLIKSLFDEMKSLQELLILLNHYQLCDQNYLSIRTLISLKNHIMWQNLIKTYIDLPKAIYNSRYSVWLISSNGLINKYIYTSRLVDIKKLNKNQSLFLLLIEIQDLFIPKVEKIIIIFGKIILYIFINIVINSTVFLIKIILNHFNNQTISE